MRYLKTIIFSVDLGVLLIGISFILWVVYVEISVALVYAESCVAVEINKVYTNEKYEAAIKYHGVKVTKWNEKTRQWEFYRDGQWIGLYSTIKK